MVFGTSVGAINGAMVCQGDLDLSDRLWRQMETDMIFDLEKDSAAPESEVQHGAHPAKGKFQSNLNAAAPKASEPGMKPAKNKEPSEDPLRLLKQQLKAGLRELDLGGMPAEDALAYAREIVTKGGAGSSGLRDLLKTYIQEENVRNSGIEYGLVMTEFPSLEGHFLYLDDIPKGQLVDHIIASASCFPAVQKCIIGDKKFIDGGYRDNMPVEMALRKGATHIIAVDLQAAGFVRQDTVEQARKETEEFHLLKSPLDLGNFLIFDQANISRIIQLGYLDTMRQWHRYDGHRYTFEKGALNPAELWEADNTAWMLRLDPCRIYTAQTLREAAEEKLKSLAPTPHDKSFKELLETLPADLSNGELRIQLICFIAQSLKEDGEKSLFQHTKFLKTLQDEVRTAKYLLQQGILS